MTSALTPFERRATEMLLAGTDDQRAVLRSQLAHATVVERQMTGVGFFADFAVPSDCPTIPEGKTIMSGVGANADGLAYGIDLVFFVNNGRLDCLEAATYGEARPETLTNPTFFYQEVTIIVQGPTPPVSSFAHFLSRWW